MRNSLLWILLVALFLIVGTQKVSAARTTPASQDPDINIREPYRGWVENKNFPKVIIPHPGQEDLKAPQLSTLIGETVNYNPIFTYLGQVKNRYGTGLDSSNTTLPGIMSIQAAGGTTVYSPRQGYDIGGGFSYVILYATNSDIVIHDTSEDSVARGYTIHLMNINVDQKLLDLYNQNEANGRQQLVAIGCHIKLGTVAGSDVLTSIRDTGSFMPQYRDWWLRQIPDCKELPPGLLTAAKRPPAGVFLDNSVGRAPLTKTETENVDISNNNTAVNKDVAVSPSSFGDTSTFPNFSKEDTKFNEMFDINNGGGELIPAQLQRKVQYPDEQTDYIGLNEVYGAGCATAGLREGNKKPDEQYSNKAAQSKALPAPYPRTQAHYNIFGSIRAKETSGLQYRTQQPDIVASTNDNTYTLNKDYQTKLFHCGDKTDSKQVPAVQIPVVGGLQAIFASISDFIKNLASIITGRVCDQNNENCYNRYQAHIDKTTTATVFLPGSPDIEKKAIDEKQGSLLTFFPASLTNRLSRRDGYTNKNQSGNVLGDTTDNNDNIPHYQMHAVKDTFTKTSSCMLIPASVQAQRGTKCELEGVAAAPTQAPTAGAGNYCTASNPGNVTNGPGFTYISDGLIALALNVSKYTCTPAEFIIGTLAGEGRGLTFDGASNQVLQGNPNEIVCRTTACVTNRTGDLGPYSWNQSLYEAQFNTWGALATDCFNALGVSSATPDSRNLGQATCTTAAKFWGSMHDNGRPVGSCSGANQRSYSLSEIPADKLELAFRHFCGSNTALCDPFWAKDQNLIKFFSSQVARVRSEMAACLK